MRTGMGNYALHLAEALTRVEPSLDLGLLTEPANAPVLSPPLAGLPRLNTRYSHESHPLGDLWEHTVLPLRLRRAGARLFHGPAVLVPLLGRRVKVVTTIHDLVPLLHPDTVPLKYAAYMRALLPRVARRADHIISDSMSNREDLIRVLKVDPDKVSVAPLAAQPVFREVKDQNLLDEVCRRYNIRRPFVYYLGNLEPRKNLVRLVRVFARVREELGGGVQLVISGQAAWLMDRLRQGWEGLRLGRQVVFTGYLPREELPLIMNAATIFAFPSRYEGFGLPVLEAMSCGVPVLTSRVSSMPEVAGDAALLIDPDDDDSLADGLKRLLADGQLRARLSAAGLARAKGYSWERTAERTAGVYRRLLGEA